MTEPTSDEVRENPQHALPRSLLLIVAWSWRLLIVGAAIVAGVYLLGMFKTIVVALLIALLFSVLLEPVVLWLNKRVHIHRGIGAVIVVLLALALIVGVVSVAGVNIAQGMGDLKDKSLEGLKTVLEWFSTGPLHIDNADFDHFMSSVTDTISKNQNQILSGAVSVTSSAVQVLTGVLIAIFCLIFFLYDGKRIWTWFIKLTPKDSRLNIYDASLRGWKTLSGYVRTQIIVAAVDAIGIGLGAWILGLPLVIPLIVLVFIGSFIPIVGAFITGAVAVFIALVDKGLGPAIIMLIIILAVQQLEGHVLQPFLMGKAVSLHPVAVLLVVAAGSKLFGIVGALFAVPVTAVANTVVSYFNGYDRFPDLGHTDDLQEVPELLRNSEKVSTE